MLLRVNGIVKDFADRRILDGVSFTLDRREKAAIAGRNGSGKTTLLRLITGADEPDKGSIQIAKGARIGYLKQHDPLHTNGTVLEEAEAARAEALALQQRLRELEVKLEHNATADDLDEYAALHEHFMAMEGYSAERDLTTVLQKMGFQAEDLTKSASALSGGERTRLALSRLILEEPDLLILDEPTNHLDLAAIEWLERWVASYPGAALIVSHDRRFLEATATKVLHMEDCVVKAYAAGFAKYEQLRKEKMERQATVAKLEKIERDKLDEFVRRFMGSERTAQARGKLKMLRRMEASATTAPKSGKSMKADFGKATRGGEVVVSLAKVTKAFGDRTLFKGVDWLVRTGERWGIVGENGAGKSTLLKVALGELEADSGTATLGSRISLGYFAQDLIDMDPSQTPLQYLVYDYDLDPGPARDLLGKYLFSGDDVFRPIRTMSGGERNKLALAALTTLSPNLLALDEPTNHLDMDSKDVLIDALKSYNGTLLLVSHDRELLEAVTTHTLDVRRDGVVQFPGSYAEYRRKVAGLSQQTQLAPVVQAQPRLSPRELSKQIGKAETDVSVAESLVTKLERELEDIETSLAKPDPSQDLHELSTRHQQVESQLTQSLEDWEEKVRALELLRAQQGSGSAD